MQSRRHRADTSLVDRSQEPVVRAIAKRIEEIVKEQDQANQDSRTQSQTLPGVDGKPPKISVFDFVLRIAQFGRCSPSCFTMAIIYLQRLNERCFEVALRSTNFQRLLSCLVLLGTKFLDDQFYSNNVWAQVAGVTLKELNELELQLLQALEFRLCVSQKEFHDVAQNIFGLSSEHELSTVECAGSHEQAAQRDGFCAGHAATRRTLLSMQQDRPDLSCIPLASLSLDLQGSRSAPVAEAHATMSDCWHQSAEPKSLEGAEAASEQWGMLRRSTSPCYATDFALAPMVLAWATPPQSCPLPGAPHCPPPDRPAGGKPPSCAGRASSPVRDSRARRSKLRRLLRSGSPPLDRDLAA